MASLALLLQGQISLLSKPSDQLQGNVLEMAVMSFSFELRTMNAGSAVQQLHSSL